MLSMYLVQQWYGLAAEAVEGAVYDSQALRNRSAQCAVALRSLYTVRGELRP